jgi:hypothetical protein
MEILLNPLLEPLIFRPCTFSIFATIPEVIYTPSPYFSFLPFINHEKANFRGEGVYPFFRGKRGKHGNMPQRFDFPQLGGVWTENLIFHLMEKTEKTEKTLC